MKRSYKRPLKLSLLLVVFLAIELTGCGFRLRGDVELPPEVRQLAIEDTATGTELVPVLNTLLRRSGIKPLDNVENARLVLVITNESYKRRVLTVSSAGQVQEYELAYSVKYSIKNIDDKNVSLMNQKVAIRRDLRFSVTEVLGKSSEEMRLKKDMINAAAEQILRRLPNATAKKP